jgi:hypothetical protein
MKKRIDKENSKKNKKKEKKIFANINKITYEIVSDQPNIIYKFF